MTNETPPDGSNAALSPSAFFEGVLPQAFAADPGEIERDEEVSLHYHVTGPEGGDWLVRIEAGELRVERHAAPALVRYSLSSQHAIEAINNLNGASPVLIIPRPPTRGNGHSGAIRALHGTLVLKLARDGHDPFSVEICFNGSAEPHTLLEMTLPDYLAMQEQRLVSRDAYLTGKMRVEGDMSFLMQVGMATSS